MTEQLSKNFYLSEFSCSCGCGFDDIDSRVVSILQEIRDHYGAPVTITSGCRCRHHNALVGGSPNSQHLCGKAADFKVKGVAPSEVVAYIDEKHPNTLGLGEYSSWVHVDVRRGRVRWKL